MYIYTKGSGLIGMLIALLMIGVFVVFFFNTFISENSQRGGVDNDPTTSVIDESNILKNGLEERHNKILEEL